VKKQPILKTVTKEQLHRFSADKEKNELLPSSSYKYLHHSSATDHTHRFS